MSSAVGGALPVAELPAVAERLAAAVLPGLTDIGQGRDWNARMAADASATGRSEAAAMLREAAEASGLVSVELFARWWLGELAVEAVGHRIRSDFEGSQLVERHSLQLRFELGAAHNCEVGHVFRRMEEARSSLRGPDGSPLVAEYAASQTTLEQIFNEMAAAGAPPPPPPPDPAGFGGEQLSNPLHV